MLRNLLLFVALPLIATPVFILIGFSIFQEKLLFHPEVLQAGTAFQFRVPSEEILLEVQGDQIHSLFFKAEDSKTLVLYFHGNAGSLRAWGQVGAELSQSLRTNFWIMDYPGYGLSSGKIKSEAQLNAVAETFADQIRARGEFDRVVIYGRSIGSGPASQLAANWARATDRPPLAGLILESPYLSLTDLVHDYAAWYPSFLLKYRFDNASALASVRVPILILHGRQDEIIPYRHGELLAEVLATTGNINFIEVPGGHHNDLMDFPEYASGLLQWWFEVTKSKASGNA